MESALHRKRTFTEGCMFAVKNVADELERRRGLWGVTSNLTALMALQVLGFPVTPATIGATAAGWAIVVVASLQFVLR